MAKTILPLIVLASAPTVSDDASAGYFVGQEWQNTATSIRYIATDVTVGAAIWLPIAAGTSIILTNITAATSAGVFIKNSSGTTVATIGAGPGVNVTLAGALAIAGSITGATTIAASGSVTASTFISSSVGSVLEATAGTTAAKYARIDNTSGTIYLGTESSVAGGFFTGSAAYDACVWTPGRLFLRGASGVAISGTTVIGTDPGGSELLRVGGSIRASGSAIIATNIVAAVGYFGETSGANPKQVFLGYGVGGATTHGIQAYQAGVGYTTLTLQPYGASCVLGTDPGGSELLRVGGAIRASGAAHYFGESPGSISNSFTKVLVQGTDATANDFIIAGPNGSQTRIQFSTPSQLEYGSIRYNHATNVMSILVSNAVAISISSGGTTVLGTDPGGSELLRVGGAIRGGGDSVFASPGAFSTLTLGDNSATSYSGLRLKGNSTQYNWQISTSNTISNGLEFALSTAATGSTYATPVMYLNSSGALILGTDPGGSELLRVGGSIRASGALAIGTDILWDYGGTAGLRLGPASAPAYIRYNTSGDLEIIPRAGYRVLVGPASFATKITTVSTVPGSFASLADVQTWLAAQFT